MARWQRLLVGRLVRQRHHLSPPQSSLQVSRHPPPTPLPAPHKPPQHHLLGDGIKSRSSPQSWHLGTQPRTLGSQAPPSRCPSSASTPGLWSVFAKGSLTGPQHSTPLLPALGTFSGAARWFPPPVQPRCTRRSCSAQEECDVSLPQSPGIGSKQLIPGAKHGGGGGCFSCFFLLHPLASLEGQVLHDCLCQVWGGLGGGRQQRRDWNQASGLWSTPLGRHVGAVPVAEGVGGSTGCSCTDVA